MEIKPEINESINTFLELILGEEDTKQFGDLTKSLLALFGGAKCWQLPVVVGVYSSILYVRIEDNTKSILEEIVDSAIKPFEILLGQIQPRSDQKNNDDEQARLRIHTQFSLGTLLLIKGMLKSDADNEKRGIALLHEMADTQLSVSSLRDYSMRFGTGIVNYHPDMGKVRTFTAIMLPFIIKGQYHSEILFHITKALPYADDIWHTFLVQNSCKLLEDWTAYCDKYDKENQAKENLADTNPTLEWLDLFAATAEILSVCEESDSIGALPNECKKESAQYLSWKFGQIAGHFTLQDNIWHDDPFKYFRQFADHSLFNDEAFEFIFGPVRTAEAFNRILSLMSEYSPERNLAKVRERYIALWGWSNSYTGLPLSEISPHTDLYWAMKIGFLDKVLEGAQQTALVPTTQQQISINNMETNKDILTVIALRQLKLEQDLERIQGRLPPDKRDIRTFLESKLRLIWRELPAPVVETLIKAEMYYKSDINTAEAKVEFFKVVEASFWHCFVTPLIDFVKKNYHGQIRIYLPPPKGTKNMNAGDIQKLSLRDWGDIGVNP